LKSKITTRPQSFEQFFREAVSDLIGERNEKLASKIVRFKSYFYIATHAGEAYWLPTRWASQWNSDLRERLKPDYYLRKAEILERAGRREEAAEIYEQYQMYDKAGELRGMAKKTISIVVDLNKLIQQVRDGGIVAVYRCPHCGGKVKIGKATNIESLRVCEHCGSEIESVELADFLRTILS